MGTKTKPKKKTYAWMPRSALLRRLMSSPAGVVSINWVFQGILGMDSTDRWFKIGFDAGLAMGVTLILAQFAPLGVAVVCSLLLAHTLNWLVNTHFFVIGRFVGFTSTPVDRIWSYSKGIAERVRGQRALLGVLIYGAVARGEGVRTTSDVDMLFIRRHGWVNAFQAAWVTFIERARAFFARFPLHLDLLDDLRRLGRLREDEKPMLLYDPDGVLQAYYANRGYERLEPEA